MKILFTVVVCWLFLPLALILANDEIPYISSLRIEEWFYKVDVSVGVVELRSQSGTIYRFTPSGISNVPMCAPSGAINLGAIRYDGLAMVVGFGQTNNVSCAYDGAVVVLAGGPTGTLYKVDINIDSIHGKNQQTVWIEKNMWILRKV